MLDAFAVYECFIAHTASQCSAVQVPVMEGKFCCGSFSQTFLEMWRRKLVYIINYSSWNESVVQWVEVDVIQRV